MGIFDARGRQLPVLVYVMLTSHYVAYQAAASLAVGPQQLLQ